MCTLRIAGLDLDVEALLRAVTFRDPAVHLKGERRHATKPAGPANPPTEGSSIHIGVSDAEFSDLPAQIADALTFLREKEADLRTALRFPGVECLVFDFPIEDRDVSVQCDVFPAALLAALGALGIELEVTRYRSYVSH